MALTGLQGGQHPVLTLATEVIRWGSANSERTLQRALGPSEIGSPCPRELAYKLAGTPVANTTSDPWFSVIGTAVHNWMAEHLDRYQVEVLGRSGDNKRFMVERRVHAAGTGTFTAGKSDVFDIDTGTVIDWKIVGKTTLDQVVKTDEVGQRYEIQGQTYGAGWYHLGYDVREICVVFLPRSNFLKAAHVWSAPFDLQVSVDALDRVATIDALRKIVPIGMVPVGPCSTFCDYLRRGPVNDQGCPGHDQK